MKKAAFSVAVALSLSAPQSAVADVPNEIQDFTRENIAFCKSVGGAPNLSGMRIQGAGQTTEEYPPYLTETGDLNGDGKPDHITDLAGLECADAWSVCCGSAGCPVTVWLSAPAGYTVGWGGSAQAWELRGKEVVVSLHGQLCKPPRVGAQSCAVAMHFDQAPKPEQSAASRTPLKRCRGLAGAQSGQ